MKNKNIWKSFSVWTRAFIILALVFLAIGLGTLGSVRSVGQSYRLPIKRSGDGQTPAIVINVTEPGHGEEGHSPEHRDLYIKAVYVNVGTVYNEHGDRATLRVAYGQTANTFYSYYNVVIPNLYETVEEDEDISYRAGDMLYNWYQIPFEENLKETGHRLTVYPYWQLTAQNCDVIVNEIVFVANDEDNKGEPVVLNTAINADHTYLPEEKSELVEKASVIIDKQYAPTTSQSSYFNFGLEEISIIETYMEMKQGGVYANDSVYHMDGVYNTLGLDILFIGPAIFGLSPFGLRFMPMLAAFGVLVFGYLFVKKLTQSDKAGFAFALIFALCGMSFSLAHFATPLMIGVCFFVASAYFCLDFFLNGLKKARFSAAVPVLLSALFAAAAICTNGAFLIPVLGIVALFVAGVVRQRKALKAEISEEAEKAIAEEEALEKPAESEEHVYSEGRKKVAKLVNEANYKHSVAIGVFVSVLVFGYVLLAILSMLPLNTVFTKVYDDPAYPTKSMFYFLWVAFSNGFVGVTNPLTASPFAFAYELYHGTGSLYAVTVTGTLVAIGAIVLGLVGAVVTLISIAKNRSADVKSALILLCGVVLSLITAVFAKGGLAFLFLAFIFLFAFAAKCLAEKKGEGQENAKAIPKAAVICGLVLICVCFLAFAVLTFSIPLPAAFMNSIFG